MQTVYPHACVVLKKYEAKYPIRKNFSLEFCDRFALQKKQNNNNKNIFSLPTTLFVDAIFVT